MLPLDGEKLPSLQILNDDGTSWGRAEAVALAEQLAMSGFGT